MSLEFRPAEPKEMREFFYSGRLGFGRSVAVDEVDRDLQDPLILPERTLCAFDDQVLAAKMVTLPLKLYWNGPTIDCGGVTAVSTLPSHRRRGYVGELLRRSFAAMRDAGSRYRCCGHPWPRFISDSAMASPSPAIPADSTPAELPSWTKSSAREASTFSTAAMRWQMSMEPTRASRRSGPRRSSVTMPGGHA
jgi:Predicted acetyltransferase involved in intracellular survival and related acetyltransferases